MFPYIKGQPYFNHDLSLFKNFSLGHSRKLQLRMSAYNFLNHPIRYPNETDNLTLRAEMVLAKLERALKEDVAAFNAACRGAGAEAIVPKRPG